MPKRRYGISILCCVISQNSADFNTGTPLRKAKFQPVIKDQSRVPWYTTPPPDRLYKKVKCTFVQALRLCTGRTAHTVSRGIAVLFLDHDTRIGCV